MLVSKGWLWVFADHKQDVQTSPIFLLQTESGNVQKKCLLFLLIEEVSEVLPSCNAYVKRILASVLIDSLRKYFQSQIQGAHAP